MEQKQPPTVNKGEKKLKSCHTEKLLVVYIHRHVPSVSIMVTALSALLSQFRLQRKALKRNDSSEVF